jgi:hypothetical protein
MYHRGLDYSMYSSFNVHYTRRRVQPALSPFRHLGIKPPRTAQPLARLRLYSAAAMSQEADRIASAQQTLDSTPALSLSYI